MPEATFDQFYMNDPLARAGWNPEYGINGEITGYWRNTALDPTRGANQQGVVEDFGIEFVPADKINGGNPDPSAVEYRSGGTNILQHNNEPFPGASTLVKLAPLLIAGAGIGSAAAAGEFGSLGGLLGGTEGAAGLGGTPEITDAMLAGANATSDPIAYLNAQAGWTAADPAYLASLTTVPVGTTTPGYAAPPAAPTAPVSPTATAPSTGLLDKVATGGLGALGTSDWAKLAAALGGGALSYLDAANQNGKTQGNAPEVYSKLMGAQQAPARQPVVGQYTNQMTGLLGQQNPALAGLLAKRYY